jgi:L-malate glycosyltransferase
MRILHTVSNYWPEHGGGSSEVVRQISERLVRRGHDLTVATKYSAKRKTDELNGVKIRHFNIDGNFRQSILGIHGNIKEYNDYLRRGGFDVIMNYAAQTWHADLMFGQLDDIKAKKVICACGYSGLIGWRRFLYFRYFKRLPYYLKKYDMVVYHSCNYRDKVFGDRCGVTNYRVIPNGVDSKSFEEESDHFRTKYGIKTTYLLLTVGDHFKNKGHARVLAAVERLGRADVTLVIIGGKIASWPRSCWHECSRAKKRADGRILLLSDAPREDVRAAFKTANIFLSGSYIEAFPLVILEAMACGVPFITFPAGNVAELQGGRIVSSIDEMKKEVDLLLNYESQRLDLGRLAKREQRERFEWDMVVRQYEQLYFELCAKH